MDKMLYVGLFLLYAGIVLGQDCNDLNDCILQFTGSFGELSKKMGDPEGIKTICSDLDRVLGEVKECQKTATGNNDQTCEQMITMQNAQIDGMASMYKKMICNPDDEECSYFSLFRCYGDYFKGLGIDSVENVDDLSEIMKLNNFKMEDIDHGKFCKYTVKADPEEIEKCVQEKGQQLGQCMMGPAGPGGPGGPPPEGGAGPGGPPVDPSTLDMPQGGPPPGSDGEGGNQGPLPDMSFDMDPFKNASIICQPGCENFFKDHMVLAEFQVEDGLIADAKSAENGTDQYKEACGYLDGKLEEAENAAGMCEVNQEIVTGMVKSNTELSAAMEHCELSIEFSADSGAVSVVLSFHLLLLVVVALYL